MNNLSNHAGQIRAEHELAKSKYRQATHHAITCGKYLAEAKQQLQHGEFGTWVRDHCGISPRTAQTYMRLASNAQRVSHLPIRQAIEMLARPRPARHLIPRHGGGWRQVFDSTEVLIEPSAVHPGYFFVTLLEQIGPDNWLAEGTQKPVAARAVRETVLHLAPRASHDEAAWTPTEGVQPEPWNVYLGPPEWLVRAQGASA